MMISTYSFAGAMASIYQMKAGEKITRHRHNHEHSTNVITGKSEVEIWDPENPSQFYMSPGDKDYVLPPNIDHEIRAIEDGTFVINIMAIAELKFQKSEAGDGGVMLDDGTVVYA